MDGHGLPGGAVGLTIWGREDPLFGTKASPRDLYGFGSGSKLPDNRKEDPVSDFFLLSGRKRHTNSLVGVGGAGSGGMQVFLASSTKEIFLLEKKFLSWVSLERSLS